MDSDEVRERWAERSGEFSPEYYAYYGPDETSAALLDLLDERVGPDASVLELGCSAGRHLAHLHENGYDDLTGIDLNPDAFDVLAETYPDLDETGTFHVGAIEEFVTDLPDDAFDAVYSVETLQHVPPEDDWVFAELARIAGDLLVTVEVEGEGDDRTETDERPAVNYVDEGVPLFYRDWNAVFTDCGAIEVESASLDRDTLRAFQPAGTDSAQ
ncbi:class I SAM-dependent methyltransferase [Halomarina salina]|uniref:Class I SAM-dependent methyltransferase n=1 Tax=Halomarina salina TaxID=1872699 RepID=A0ABD5RMW4_9EURY|nr:class I SAM-dependent methyltransferase [Halomarina salina]